MSPLRWRRLAILLASMAGLAACDREPATAPDAVDKSPQSSPRVVIEELIELRNRAAYQDIGDLVAPGRESQVVALLMAVDDFLHANDALCEYVRREFAVGLSQAIDQSHWSKRLGVFSAHAKVIGEYIEGSDATVSFMVDGSLPVRRAKLRLVGGRWLYDPGSGFDPRMVEAFAEMARGLRQTLAGLKEGRPSTAEIRAEPELLLEEIRIRLTKGISLLPTPPATRPASESG